MKCKSTRPAARRHKQFGNPRAILRDGRAQAGAAGQRKSLNPRPIWHAAEQMRLHSRRSFPFVF